MKKMVYSCLALVLVMAISACNNSNNTASPSEPASSSPAAAAIASSGAPTTAVNEDGVTPAGTYPIVEEPLTLKVFSVKPDNVLDLNTNEFTQWYEEKTNIKVDWDLVPKTGSAERLQVTLAGGKFPDVFLTANLTMPQLVTYGSQGIFLPLNDLIDQYAPNVKKMMEQSPYIKDYMTAPDGNIYALPNFGETLHTSMPKKGWIYQPWLDELGLQMPTTTDEFYNVLKAFKAAHPDAAPYSGAAAANNEPESYIMQSFLFYDNSNYLYMDNGQLKFVTDSPNYQEGLRYLHKLAQEGLLQKEAFVQDRKALTALAENPGEPKVGAVASLFWGHFTVNDGDSGRYLAYQALPVLKGPDGKAYGNDRGFAPNQIGAFTITNMAKNPAAAMRWIDWFFDTDNMYTDGWSSFLGKEGVGWERAGAGEVGLDGQPAKYKVLQTFGVDQNHHWSQTAPTYQSDAFRRAQAAVTDDDQETRLYQVTKEKYVPYSAIEMKVPPVYMSADDLTKFGDIQHNIVELVKQFEVGFITGSLDLDKDWDKYLKQLGSAGLADYRVLMNKSLENRNKH